MQVCYSNNASSIVPGGVRCTGILHSSVELIEVMTTLGMRMDVLSVVLLSHRVWSTRLTGCGALSYNALPTFVGWHRCNTRVLYNSEGLQHALSLLRMYCYYVGPEHCNGIVIPLMY